MIKLKSKIPEETSNKKLVNYRCLPLLILGSFLIAISVIIGIKITEQIFTNGQLVESTSESEEKYTKLLVFGDSGNGSDEQKRLADLINAEHNIDGVIHTGDLAYDSGTYEELIRHYSDVYDKHILDAFLPSIGNHDNKTNDAQPYLELFKLPEHQLSSQDKERYYSTDINNVHLISLDTTNSLERVSDDRNDDMLDWLNQDLRAVDSSKTIIVFFHHPPFNSGKHEESEKAKQFLVPVFERYGVDLVLNGHDHNYQRTCELKISDSEPVCREGGVTYVVTGGGGMFLYPFEDQTPDYIEHREVTFHYVVLNVDNQSGNIFGEAIDINGKVIDEFVIN